MPSECCLPPQPGAVKIWLTSFLHESLHQFSDCSLDLHVLKVQARTLMTLTYAFYSDPVSFLHVHKFNHSPCEFNFAELAKELGIGQPET